jgi:hypothetical protein
MSRTSFSLRFGRNTILMPARCAASTFSFTPPIGNALPRRSISPVIATSLRTGRFVNDDTTAHVSATPADGPSFLIAPCGKWMCRSLFAILSWSMPRRVAFARIHETAACADSFITSPIWPVRRTSPLPG